jgi:hypothetical protein
MKKVQYRGRKSPVPGPVLSLMIPESSPHKNGNVFIIQHTLPETVVVIHPQEFELKLTEVPRK